MSDSKSGRLRPELITNCINELAQDVGAMEPDDPRWATVLDELSQLTQLKTGGKIRKRSGRWAVHGRACS